jgi:DNA polymerase-3 subunit epsilon
MDYNNSDASALIKAKTRQQYWSSNRSASPKKYQPSMRKAVDYVVLDFETTGLRAGADQIIQVGAVKYINHEQVESMNQLIDPQRDISSRITSLTGITNESVRNQPTIQTFIHQLIDFIGDYPIVAHNASFDMSFLYALDQHTEIPRYSVIDTLKLARKVIRETPNHKLTTLSQFLRIEHDAHDAIGDCLVTAQIYQYCLRYST